jgi:hypothetical protein
MPGFWIGKFRLVRWHLFKFAELMLVGSRTHVVSGDVSRLRKEPVSVLTLALQGETRCESYGRLQFSIRLRTVGLKALKATYFLTKLVRASVKRHGRINRLHVGMNDCLFGKHPWNAYRPAVKWPAQWKLSFTCLLLGVKYREIWVGDFHFLATIF